MISKTYTSIIKTILDYLPSRGLIILNSLLIIPLLTGILSQKEISLYFIVIQILNLVCTCSFDGIGKASLRFWEKHVIENNIDKFVSNILLMSVWAYGITFLLFLFLHPVLTAKLSLSYLTQILTLILIVPCGIRQVLYQVLRVKELSKIYTYSIVFYQLLFIFCFLLLTKIVPNTDIVICSMILSIIVTDIYVFARLKFNYKITFSPDRSIINEVLIYILPLFLTNFCYWFILNFSKLAFQSAHQFVNTALIGTAWVVANNFLKPVITLFIFATFPVIVRRFEHNKNVKGYFTSIMQLYVFIFLPLVFVFCAFPKEITAILLPENYAKVALVLPVFAISNFLHEFLKLVNVKYHLKNMTYIETIFALLFVAISYFGTVHAVQVESIVIASVFVLICESGLILSSTLVRFKDLNYIDYVKILKTTIYMLTLCVMCACVTSLFNHLGFTKLIFILKMILFTVLCYTLSINLRKYLLR